MKKTRTHTPHSPPHPLSLTSRWNRNLLVRVAVGAEEHVRVLALPRVARCDDRSQSLPATLQRGFALRAPVPLKRKTGFIIKEIITRRLNDEGKVETTLNPAAWREIIIVRRGEGASVERAATHIIIREERNHRRALRDATVGKLQKTLQIRIEEFPLRFDVLRSERAPP